MVAKKFIHDAWLTPNLRNSLTLKVLNFWKFTSYCSLKPLWSGMGGSSAGSYLTYLLCIFLCVVAQIHADQILYWYHCSNRCIDLIVLIGTDQSQVIWMPCIPFKDNTGCKWDNNRCIVKPDMVVTLYDDDILTILSYSNIIFKSWNDQFHLHNQR